MNADDVQAKVDQLARGFLLRLPLRMDKIDAAFALCRAGDAGADAVGDAGGEGAAAWQELYRLLHSLGGAAGTFGVHNVGQEARRIELAIQQLLGDAPADASATAGTQSTAPGSTRSARIDAIGAALQGLRGMAAAAGQQGIE